MRDDVSLRLMAVVSEPYQDGKQPTLRETAGVGFWTMMGLSPQAA